MKIRTTFLKCITKTRAALTENMQLKVKSLTYFPGLFNPRLNKSEIYTKKCFRLCSYTAKTYVWNKRFTNSAGTFLRFSFTNSVKFWGNQISDS